MEQTKNIDVLDKEEIDIKAIIRKFIEEQKEKDPDFLNLKMACELKVDTNI